MSRVANKGNDNDAMYIHPDDQNRARITFHPLSRKLGTTTRAVSRKDFHPRSGVQTKEVNQDGREQSWSGEGTSFALLNPEEMKQLIDLVGSMFPRIQ